MMTFQYDIWGNISKFKNRNFWVKQSYIGEGIIEYSDSDGNYWNKNILNTTPFSEYVYDYEAFWSFTEGQSVSTSLTVSHDEEFDLMTISPMYYIYGNAYCTEPMILTFPELTFIEKVMNKIKNGFNFINIFKRKRKGLIDPQTGELELRYNQLPNMQQEFFL